MKRIFLMIAISVLMTGCLDQFIAEKKQEAEESIKLEIKEEVNQAVVL